MPATPPDFEISPLRPDETEAAVALWEACGLTRPWNDPRADIALALGGATSTVLAGRIGGALAATAMTGADGHRCWVYYLAVDPARQKTGLGRAMMDAVQVWAVAHGMPKIQLMVRRTNSGVVSFYEALGYRMDDTVVLGKRLDGR